MSIEIGALIAVSGTLFGIILSYLNWKRNDNKDVKNEALHDGEIRSDLKYILKILEDIRIDFRVQEKRVNENSERIVKMEESIKSAHRRIDEIEKK